MKKLRKGQLKALTMIHNGSVLCGDTGTGKSLTAIAYYYLLNGGNMISLTGGDYHYMKKKPMDLYIITTALKRDRAEWDMELAPFLITRHKEDHVYDHKVVIDSWNNILKYVGVHDSFFIFDEQRVVGKGAWVKSFLKIVKSNQWILLSATPGDNWGDYIPLFIANGFYKDRKQFSQEHEIYARFLNYPKVEKYINTKRLEYYRNKILIDMEVRRPAVAHHEVIPVQFDGQKYKDTYKYRFNWWKEKPIENAGELCYCLRKIVNSDPSRAAALLELAETHPKIIVFYNFDYERDILLNLGYSSGTAVAEWNGHVHQPIPVESERWIYIVQYTAGAEGWNCVETDTMVFYSQNYSYKIMHQAAGRIDRMNTPYINLYYFHFKSSSAIDIAISRALENKKKFNERKFIKW